MSSYSIIGSGAIGSALAGHFASKGIEVLLANNRGPASLEDLVRKLGPQGEGRHVQRRPFRLFQTTVIEL